MDIAGDALLITIDRGHAMNVLDPDNNDALADATEQFEGEDEVRVAVVTGAGTLVFARAPTSNDLSGAGALGHAMIVTGQIDSLVSSIPG